MRKHYSLFRLSPEPFMYRIGEGGTVQEACREAFGTVYDSRCPTVHYKDMGSRSPRSMTNKVKREFYGPENWLPMP